MSHHLDETMCRCIEFGLLLLAFSCSMWLSCYAAWLAPFFG
jgi:hypothetical protein